MKAFIAFFQTIVLLLLCMTVNSQSASAAERSTPIRDGDVAPDFTLEDQNRNKIKLSESLGKNPTHESGDSRSDRAKLRYHNWRWQT